MPTVRLFRLALAASLAVSAALYFVWTWHWPLVGDASLIHYIAFLIERGWAPYRQLGDMNMPGAFLVEMAAMRVFGGTDLGWRLFDFTLMASAAASFAVLCRIWVPLPRDRDAREASVGLLPPAPSILRSLPHTTHWLPALFASSLFLLIHGRDGLAEGGQRDLTMAVLLVAATAFLFLAIRRQSTIMAALFGLLSGLAVTIKPTALPLTAVQLVLALTAAGHATPRNAARTASPWRRYALPALLAYMIAPAAALFFLLRERALQAFLEGLRTLVPYYAGLGHRPFSFVLLHSISPLLPLVLIWFAVLTLRPSILPQRNDWERLALLAGILFGLLSCIVQQRALPYYRYPLLVFLLPVLALEFTQAFDRLAPHVAGPSVLRPQPTLRTRTAGLLALAALTFGSFFLAPQSAILLHRYRWREIDFITSLQHTLTGLGGSTLSGRIQCIDSISGCNNVLYRMRLEPATGVLSDFLLFGAVSDTHPPDKIPILRDTRIAFAAALTAHPPQVIVLTSHLHMDGPDDFRKLDRWPAFESFLAQRYVLFTEWSPSHPTRWWSREETPASYRVYVLRSPTAPPNPHP